VGKDGYYWSDLRKPKLYEEFNLSNEVESNYLIKQKWTKLLIIRRCLIWIFVRPVPPNPSELLMGDSMSELIEDKENLYNFGYAARGIGVDALELSQYSDVTLYIVRQNFTKKK
jgi:hypothetical protein